MFLLKKVYSCTVLKSYHNIKLIRAIKNDINQNISFYSINQSIIYFKLHILHCHIIDTK